MKHTTNAPTTTQKAAVGADIKSPSFIQETASAANLSPIQKLEVGGGGPSTGQQEVTRSSGHQSKNPSVLAISPNLPAGQKKSIKKVGTTSNIIRYNSPTSSSILNKTIPISPLRGGSRVKERPSKGNPLAGYQQQPQVILTSNTPSNKSSQSQMHNKLAQTVSRFLKKDSEPTPTSQSVHALQQQQQAPH